MRHIALIAASAALLATAGAAQATSFSFTTIDNPADPTFNQLLGINNGGTIAGYFGSGTAGHPNKGYTIAAPYTKFKPDNMPTSAQTQATGINSARTTSGFWAPTNLGAGDANFGFIRWVSNGVYQYLNVNDPLTSSNPPVNQVLGINDSQNAVGFYNDSAGASHAFLYSVTTGRFTPIGVPGAVSAAATGINNANLISGFFTGKTRTSAS